ncbi:Peptidyl-prolyl isomerase cwc27 [Thecaphora frezii]
MKQREDEANASKERGKTKEQEQEQEDEEQDEEARVYGVSDGDDADWRNHRLEAGGVPLSGREDKYTIDDYEVLDPRRQPKPEESKRNGKRGRDWVEDRNYTGSRSGARHEERSRNQQRRYRDVHARGSYR